MTAPPTRRYTLGAELERLRLQHRERRLQAAVAALKARTNSRHAPALGQAIHAFHEELRTVRAKLDRT